MTKVFKNYKISVIVLLIIVGGLWIGKPAIKYLQTTGIFTRITDKLVVILANDKNVEVRKESVIALGKMNCDEAADSILKEMMSFYELIDLSRVSLIMMGNKCVPSVLREFEKAKTDSLVNTVPQEKLKIFLKDVGDYSLAIEESIKDIFDNEAKKIADAAEYKSGDKYNWNELTSVDPAFIDYIKKENSRLYYYINLLAVLGNLKDPRSAGVLIRFIDDETNNQILRWFALRAIIDIEGENANTYLLKCITDKNPMIRRIAISGLGDINSKFDKMPAIKKYW